MGTDKFAPPANLWGSVRERVQHKTGSANLVSTNSQWNWCFLAVCKIDFTAKQIGKIHKTGIYTWLKPRVTSETARCAKQQQECFKFVWNHSFFKPRYPCLWDTSVWVAAPQGRIYFAEARNLCFFLTTIRTSKNFWIQFGAFVFTSEPTWLKSRIFKCCKYLCVTDGITIGDSQWEITTSPPFYLP